MIACELDDGVTSQTTTIVKSLPLLHGLCRHTNVVRVARTQNNSHDALPQILSSIAEKEENAVRRRTEIKYLRMRYTIQDHFFFQVSVPEGQQNRRESRSFISSSQDSGNSHQSNQNQSHSSQPPPTKINRKKNKKVCLFQKTSINGKSFAKRNTKNIPKNFCKAFGSHMEGLPHTEEWSSAMKDFKKIEKRSKSKYNNILIHRLLSHPRICVYFKEFLEHHAAEWINSSKIADKQIHLEAIQIYYKLLDSLVYAEVDPCPSDE